MTAIKTLLVLTTAFLTLACSSMGGGSVTGTGNSQVTEATAKQLSGDVPLPQGAVIRQQESLVMGSGNSWTGRLSLSVGGDAQAVFAWFRDSMPASGWTLTSSSFSKLSMLTFTKGERLATVQIQSASFGGNEVLVTVSPAARPAAAR